MKQRGPSGATTPKRVCFVSTAMKCSSSLLENAMYSKAVMARGLECTENPDTADILVINSCGYSSDAENRSFQALQEYQNKYPNKEIIFGGCLTKINPENLSTLFKGKTFAPGELGHLLKHMNLPFDASDSVQVAGAQLNSDSAHELPWYFKLFSQLKKFFFFLESHLGVHFQPLHNALTAATIDETFYVISAGNGCLGTCTYCAIRKARGKVKSTPLNEILSAFRLGLSMNKKKFWLNADDLGCWGQDLGLTVVDLIAAISGLDGNFEVVLTYFSPEWLLQYFDRLAPFLKDPRFVASYIPIHSGSDRVLKNMGRRYDAKTLLNAISQIRAGNPNMAIKTNFILAFPGETISDLLLSCLAIFHFDFIVTNIFSPRPGTPAASLPGEKGREYSLTTNSLFQLLVLGRHGWIALKSILLGWLV